ncbi:MAG: hypothetical protein H6696_15210 [Deferribacteres bacterium]|nr:hypothetical protein [candidate division KSB1 bacterium]MCB9503276.1 hypothetical protein [Deferribacteres bacterium]
MKFEKKTATYKDLGILELENGVILKWDQLELPFGSIVEIVVEYVDIDYLRGTNGIVWATYDLEQAEIIRSALEAQGIASEIGQNLLIDVKLHVLKITNVSHRTAAIDFIWRSDEGLKLLADWHYPLGTHNESFVRWLEGR